MEKFKLEGGFLLPYIFQARMKEFKIYSVSDKYIEYLRKEVPNVYSNKVNNRKHTRKYVGVVIRIGRYNYYIPMSSPKNSDYQIAGDKNTRIRIFK